MNRETLQMILDLNLRSIADLKARYGTSTRPAWVGEEIGMLQMRVDDVRAQLKELGE